MSIDSFYYPKITTLPDVWRRSSFTTLGALWIASNNSLTPSDYKIRKIQDQGSIKDSIITSDIHLFDRQIDTDFSTNKVLARIVSGLMRMVILLGVFTFIAPLGGIWHLGNSVYHTVLWIKGERQIHLKKHIDSLIYDLAWSIFVYSIVAFKMMEKLNIKKSNSDINPIVGFIIAGGLFCELFIKPILIIVAGLSPQLLDMFIVSNATLTLKEHFGLVGENGWLLTFSQAVDAPTIKEDKTANAVILSGYFCDLLEEQATNVLLEFRQITDLLKLELKEEELQTVSKNPEKFLPYLRNLADKSKGETLCDEVELSQSIARINQAFENCKSIRSLLSEVLPSNVRLALFPFSPETCRSYFAYQYEGNQTTEQLLNNFKDLLAKIKEAGLLEGGPSDNFIKIKQNILNANNAYEILGLKTGTSKEICKKAYIKSVLPIHPDKIPGVWQAQATELFKVMDAAHKYISSV